MDRLDELLVALRGFTDERDWAQFHDPKNLAMLLASEAGELLSLLRWVPNSSADEFAKDQVNRQRLSHEVADVAIALLLLCDRIGLDLPTVVHDKLAINAQNYPAAQSKGSAVRLKR